MPVAVALSVSDPIAYAEGHSQSLGSAWPLAGILSAGIAFGGMGGAAAGVVDGWRSAAVRDAAPRFGCGYPGNSATMRR